MKQNDQKENRRDFLKNIGYWFAWHQCIVKFFF